MQFSFYRVNVFWGLSFHRMSSIRPLRLLPRTAQRPIIAIADIPFLGVSTCSACRCKEYLH